MGLFIKDRTQLVSDPNPVESKIQIKMKFMTNKSVILNKILIKIRGHGEEKLLKS